MVFPFHCRISRSRTAWRGLGWVAWLLVASAAGLVAAEMLDRSVEDGADVFGVSLD